MSTRSTAKPAAESWAAASSAEAPTTDGTATSAPLATGAAVVGGAGGAVVVGACGAVKLVAGTLAIAALMNCCQIRAGHVPPYTVRLVVGGVIVTSDWGKPAHTAVDKAGV